MSEWTAKALDGYNLVRAINDFHYAMPGRWLSFGECSVSCHASCGPDRKGANADLLAERLFDDGFHADLDQPSTMARAIADVMEQAITARNGR